MATIVDVAARAGVGIGTVSRVLNDSPAVSERTKAKVLAAIAELEYRPSPLARGLPRGRVHTVGTVVPFVTNPSVVERIKGVVAALTGSGYDLALFDVESPAQRDDHFRTLSGRDRASGLVVMSMPPTELAVDRWATARLPVVLVDARHPRLPAVVTDDVAGGRLAARHLLELGHRRIGFVGDLPGTGLGFTASTDRLRGFRATLQAAGVPLPERWVAQGPHDLATARQMATAMLALPERPTAIFAASDTQAIGVLEAARQAAVPVPGDLSILGFDDVQLAAYIGLSTVRQPLAESGRLGAELLLAAMADAVLPPPVTHELPLELVARSTTAPPRLARPPAPAAG